MKKIVILIGLIVFSLSVNAQETVGGRVLQKAKDKTYQKGEDNGDEVVDKTLNKVEEGIKGIFKKKDKKKKDAIETTDSTEESSNSENESQPTTSTTKKPVKSNSKFDFVAGEKELYFDNFERLSLGDFPAEFNTNASGEIVNLDDQQGKWLNMTKNGAFVPDNIKKLPENFTLEFEVGISGEPTNNYSGFGLNFTTQPDELMKDMFFATGTSIVYLHPGAGETAIQVIPVNGTEIENRIQMPQWDVNSNTNFAKVSVWRQKGRLRLYVNEDKIVDVPRFFTENTNYDFAFFRSFFGDCEIYITNIRYAVAGADTRNKLITEGRFVTNGILFDVNSDRIKPESATVLNEMATVLKENPTVKVKIIGHTDSDGDASANLSLSQKRAVAVKNSLSTNYGIEADRLQTDGKGENEPLNGNKTTTEKAQNRRVEFIKL